MQSRPRGLRELCRLLGYSPQAYYQYHRTSVDRVFKEELVFQQIEHHRRLQPRIGARKLLVMLGPFLQEHSISMGRDVFFDMLRWHGLLVRKRRRSTRTTLSFHRFNTYTDQVKGLRIERPEQVWVSDITYLRSGDKFFYLSLVTDAYSRKIMGYHVSPDLKAEGCLKALGMAIGNRSGPELSLLHHSDRGVQYCCSDYINVLRGHGIKISMTQGKDPRDNAIAERVNGILKEELLAESYTDLRSAKRSVAKAVTIYNELRPHSSVNMLTPTVAHRQNGDIRRRWQNYYKTPTKLVNARLT